MNIHAKCMLMPDKVYDDLACVYVHRFTKETIFLFGSYITKFARICLFTCTVPSCPIWDRFYLPCRIIYLQTDIPFTSKTNPPICSHSPTNEERRLKSLFVMWFCNGIVKRYFKIALHSCTREKWFLFGFLFCFWKKGQLW